MPAIEHNGVRIHYEDLGSGPPIVLGHSFLCSGEMWESQVPVLAERHRVLNIDGRGHGSRSSLGVGKTGGGHRGDVGVSRIPRLMANGGRLR